MTEASRVSSNIHVIEEVLYIEKLHNKALEDQVYGGAEGATMTLLMEEILISNAKIAGFEMMLNKLTGDLRAVEESEKVDA